MSSISFTVQIILFKSEYISIFDFLNHSFLSKQIHVISFFCCRWNGEEPRFVKYWIENYLRVPSQAGWVAMDKRFRHGHAETTLPLEKLHHHMKYEFLMGMVNLRPGKHNLILGSVKILIYVCKVIN